MSIQGIGERSMKIQRGVVMIRTKEMEDIINAVQVSDKLLIDATAGSGKTTILAEISKVLGLPTLMLVFGKSAQLDAETRFPGNVEVRTTHSMAYRAVGCAYEAKLSRPKGRYLNVAGTGSEIAKYFSVKPLRGKKIISAAYLGLLARNTVSNYESSADTALSSKHLPPLDRVVDRYGVKMEALRGKVLPIAEALWESRVDIESDVLITHDTYMKLWQLSNPKLTSYEVILLDEAQDTSDCVLEIFKAQTHAKRVAVGDSRQAIYGWRGAVNAMKKLKWDVKPLTTSFRYGQEVADLASKVLRNSVSITSAVNLSTSIAKVDRELPYTILYRSNARLIMDAVKQISKGDQINLEIDTADFCRKLESCEALFKGMMNKVKHEDVLSFGTWDDLVVEAKGSAELNRIQRLVEAGKVQYVINSLNAHRNKKNASCIMTTAHKSKGREWDQVVLAEDFPSNYNSDGKWVGISEEEENLLYVAVTRGRSVLEPNSTIEEYNYYGVSEGRVGE